MSQFQGSQGAILEFTLAGHICCGFSPFLHAAVAAQVCSRTLLQYLVLGFIMPFLAVSEEQNANAKPLEPAFEALLRTVDLDGELITILRVRNVLDREIFSSLEMNEGKIRETIASACGIDNTNFEHKLGAHLPFKRRSSPRSMRFRKLTVSQFRCYRKIGPVSCDSLKKDLGVMFMRPNYQHNLTTKRFRKNCRKALWRRKHSHRLSAQVKRRNRRRTNPSPHAGWGSIWTRLSRSKRAGDTSRLCRQISRNYA